MNKDLAILRKKYVDKLLDRPETDEALYYGALEKAIPGSFEGTVRFSDIDYDDPSGNTWPLPGHLHRALDLAVVITRGTYEKMDEVKEFFYKVIDEWIKCDYINSNWWFNEICAAGIMSDVCLLTWDILDDERRFWCDLVISRGSLKYNYSARQWTGANQLWGTDIAAKHAIILDDIDYMKSIADRMYVEVQFAEEGIQLDGSYFQHGPRLYIGGYGRNFLSSLMGMLNKFAGTPFALPKEKADILEFHILDGVRWMIHRDIFDWCAVGREFSRPGWGGAGMDAGAAKVFAEVCEPTRKDELLKFNDDIQSMKVGIQGVKYFPVIQMMCTHIDDIYIGFKGISTKTVAGEVCNEEGILCANMSYGTSTCVMNTGREYLEMSPVWDFTRVPGTTTRYETDAELSSHSYDCNVYQKGDRFDGGQLDDCAYSAQTVKHHGIEATVVAFGTPEGVVILGSGIKTIYDEELFTTVEQCEAMGEVKADRDLVSHNGVRYVNLDPENGFITKVEERTGSWKKNNVPMNDLFVTKNVIEIILDRGHDGYAYLIQPETKNGKFEVIMNTEDIQAVRIPDGRVLAHFFKDAEIEIDGKTFEGKKCTCSVITL